MRIKRSHLESLHFVVGTFLSCFLVISVSSNLQAHPLVRMMAPKADLKELSESASSTCTRNPSSTLEEVSVVEPEIAAALVAYTTPMTESIEDVMDDACARESASQPESIDTESLNALLTTIESALNIRPPRLKCEDLDSVFAPANASETHIIASR